jgi:hypothetical protein
MREPGQIDWDQPWLAIYRSAANTILAGPDRLDAFNREAAAAGLCNCRGLPVRFVPQSDLPPGVAYEAHIAATGCVPTRNNLHDFFNGLVWLVFPAIKAALNRVQSDQISAYGIGDKRGKVRDGATIFDENAALFVTSDPALVRCLRDRQWQQLFVARRMAFPDQARPWLFGHALLEKLCDPYKAITAHAFVCRMPAGLPSLDVREQLALVDREVSTAIAAEGLTTRSFTPLPVLGVPGWCQGQDEAFYADRGVFRPALL